MAAKTTSIMSRVLSISTVFVMALTLLGCSVSTSHRDEHDNGGKGKDVDIRTPFGSLSVHQGTMEAKDTGLSPYPGAQLKKSSDHEGDSSANVNISSSMFGMKLVALKYSTKDSPDKVLGFYRKELSKYGNVVDCKGGFKMNFEHRDKGNADREVTCNGNGNGDGEYKQELMVGTENNQRIVAIKPVGDGTEFALVYVRTRDDKDTM